MGKKRTAPRVAICGRPNVGKSTLFNRIAGKPRAIVHEEEGITRDRAYAAAEWNGRRFQIVDTGGIVEDPIDPVIRKMQDQVRVALAEADVIVFVVDGRQELTRVDLEMRDELFTYGKPLVLAVNKLDNEKLEMNRFEYCELGMGDPYAVSATHGRGVDDLLEAVMAHLPPAPAPAAESEAGDAPAEAEPPVTKVAIVGKPNVGKSSFLNALLNEERAIVDDVPGTTRDALNVEFHWKGRDYLLIDTAGLRKKAGIKRQVEYFSVARSLRAVRQADVCIVMVDAVDGITEQDKRIFDYVQEQGTGMVLVWSKWDLIQDKEARLKELAQEIDLKAPFLRYVPFMTISNVTRQRLFKTFDFVDRVAAQAAKRISTPELNRFMETLRGEHAAPAHRGKTGKILYATQVSVKPATFVLFVRNKSAFHFSHLRFVENHLREQFGFEGVPLHLELREGKGDRE